MNKVFLFILFIFSIFRLEAQNKEVNIYYHINLKDGGFLKGSLISDKKADPLILKTFSGIEIRIPQSSIKSISEVSTDQKIIKNGKSLQPDGMYKTILFGLMVARDDDPFNSGIILGLNVFNFSIGHQFNQRLAVGGGIGWDIYDMSVLSVHADFRGFLNEKPVSPYYAFQAGYGIAQDYGNNFAERIELKGGPLIHPAFGVRFATRKRANFLVEMGYRFQWAERNDPERQRFDEIIYKRLDIRFGWKF